MALCAGRTLVKCVLPSGSGPGPPVPAWADSTTGPWWSGSVSEPWTGKATAAALASVAAAFGVGRRSVTMSGARSRVKVLDVPGADPRTLERLLAKKDRARPQFGGLPTAEQDR
jgi:hypothetical protein